MKYFGVIVVLVVAFGLGGCARNIVHPPAKGAEYDESKSFAYNVLNATTTDELTTMDSPAGGMTKQHADDSAYEAAARKESAMDVGLSAAYNSAVDSAWGSGQITSGGLSNMDSLGISAGLLLLGNLGNDKFKDWKPDHGVMYFGWLPSEGIGKVEAKEKFLNILYDAHKNAAATFEMDCPYKIGAVEKDGGTFKLPVWAKIEGGYCDTERVHCRFATTKNIEIDATETPSFLEKGKAWQVVTWSQHPVFDNYYFNKEDSYEKPKFDEVSFYLELSKYLPKEVFIHVPGSTKYRDIFFRDVDGGLAPLKRPLLLNQGRIYKYSTPSELPPQGEA
jgi:hypothetical protein